KIAQLSREISTRPFRHSSAAYTGCNLTLQIYTCGYHELLSRKMSASQIPRLVIPSPSTSSGQAPLPCKKIAEALSAGVSAKPNGEGSRKDNSITQAIGSVTFHRMGDSSPATAESERQHRNHLGLD